MRLSDYYANSTYTTGVTGLPGTGNSLKFSVYLGKSKNKIEIGGVTYTTPGARSFVVPAGVSLMSVVSVGGGGGGGSSGGANGPGGSGGSGGALAFKKNWPVTAGDTVTVFVGAGGNASQAGQTSYVSYAGNALNAGGGRGGVTGSTAYTIGGTPSGYYDGGGNGGRGAPGGPDNGDDGKPGGGGGAGGYTGAGGDGGQAQGGTSGLAGASGSGGGAGGGGGGNGTFEYSANGGGVGIFGPGANGAGGAASVSGAPNPGRGGSGGSDGATGFNSTAGAYGGGGGGLGGDQNSSVTAVHPGGVGAVRIVYGPSTTSIAAMFDLNVVYSTGVKSFSFIEIPGGEGTLLAYLQGFGVSSASANTGTGSWLSSYSGDIPYLASPFAANSYFTQYGRVRVIDGDGSSAASNWCVFNFGPANGGGSFAHFGGSPGVSGGTGSQAGVTTGYVWGFSTATLTWILLYQLPLPGTSTLDHVNGNWFSSGGTVTTGNGKRAAYDSQSVSYLGFSVS